jgi:hypothetical protein
MSGQGAEGRGRKAEGRGQSVCSVYKECARITGVSPVRGTNDFAEMIRLPSSWHGRDAHDTSRLFDAPFEDAGGDVLFELDFEADGGGLDLGEGGGVELVLFDAVRGGARDFLPVVAGFVEEAPGGGGSALAFLLAGFVVEPVDLGLGELARFVEVVFDPFGGALVVPPGHSRDTVIVAGFGD